MYKFKLHLDMDGAFLQSARVSLEQARQFKLAVDSSQQRLGDLQQERTRLQTIIDGLPENHPGLPHGEQERDSIDFEISEFVSRDVRNAYGPYLSALANVHVSSAAALETHMNVLVRAYVPESRRKEFDEQGAYQKWANFHCWARSAQIPIGRDPFLGLNCLILTRNNLLHYKRGGEEWDMQSPVPTFLADLGLTLEAAMESVATAEACIRAVDAHLGYHETSEWLDPAGAPDLFRVEVPDELKQAHRFGLNRCAVVGGRPGLFRD